MLVSTISQWPALADNQPPPLLKSTFSYTTPPNFEMPLVQVRMNNKLMGTFAIDTGTSNTVVTDKLAEKLGLTPALDFKDGQPYKVEGQLAQGVTLIPMQIANITFTRVDVLVVQEHRLTSVAGQPLNGIIGNNILSLFSIYFDFPRHQMTWYRGGLASDVLKAAGFERASVLPMTLQPDTDDYVVPVQLRQGSKSVQENLLLDTGGGTTTISKKSAQQFNLTIVANQVQKSFRGNFGVNATQLETIQVGNIEVTNKLVMYPSDDNSSFPSLLGVDILAGYQVLVDFPNKKMYIQSTVPLVKISKPLEKMP